MKAERSVLKFIMLIALATATVARAASLATVENSPLSVPVASIASLAAPGSNFMITAMASLQGGQLSVKKSQQWVQRYNSFGYATDDANALVARKDGSVVVTGTSTAFFGSYDFATLCYAADGTVLWTNRYDSPWGGDDAAHYIAANDNGDVWVSGGSEKQGQTLSMMTDVVTIRYASNGVPVWTNRYSSFETNGVGTLGLVADNSGNVYVAVSAAYWVGYSGTSTETAIIKYDPAGNVVWTKHFLDYAPDSGLGLHEVEAIAVDAAGNFFAAGLAGNQVYIEGGSLIQYDGNGTEVRTNNFAFPLVSLFRNLRVDSQQNIILTGETYQNGYLLVMKRSANGTMLWTNTIPMPTYDGGLVPQTSVDASGNVFFIGGSPGSDVGFYQAVKFSPAGVPVWTNANIIFGTNNMIGDSGVDVAGNLYVTGESPDPNTGYYDYLTYKCSSDGQITWSNRFNALGNWADVPSALTVDSAGNVFVTGYSTDLSGDRDYCTVKYADTAFYSPPKDFTGVDKINCAFMDTFGNSITGTVDAAVSPGAFHFHDSSAQGGGLKLQLNGIPGTNSVVLEATTDLSQWQPILTNTPASGAVEFDLTGTGSWQFYRAYQPQ